MNKPKLLLTVGLPASGKSTYAKELAIQENANIHSSDELRQELLNDINDQSANVDVFKELHRRIKEDLINGKSVIMDATNISYKRRMTFLQELNKIDCEKICIMIATPYEQCLAQNKMRDRVVPEEIIKRMYLQMDIPAYFEGWNKIHLIYNHKKKYDMETLFSRLDNIDQCNPHHQFSIGIHCKSCAAHICSYYIDNNHKMTSSDKNILIAGMFHDVAKEFTKQFKNTKGEDTEHAHFYNHENVSAYDSLFYLYEQHLADIDILDICQLIRYHMQPFHINGSLKAEAKFIKLVGQEFYDRLMILHLADKKAH